MPAPKSATWIQMSDPAVVEVLGAVGLDYLIIDMEHSSLSVEQVANLMRAIPRDSTTLPLVRVKDHELLSVRLPLDMGAAGVIAPMVETREQAERLVKMAKFPPCGVRGTSYCRMNGWGRHFADYQASAGRLLTIMMIETPEGARNVEAILDVEGVDGVLVGHYDLSAFSGVAGKFDHPLVLEAEKRILAACHARDKIVGTLVFVPDEKRIARMVEVGFNLVSVGGDATFMRDSAQRYLPCLKPKR